MDESMKKTRERLMDEFRQASSAEKWSKECIELMKNILKSIYYIDVVSAMSNGNEYPGSDYMPSSSYANDISRRNGMSRYGKTNSYRNTMSSRMYYDDELAGISTRLERMMDTEMNPDRRAAIQDVLYKLQSM